MAKKDLVKIHLLIKVNTEKRPQIACERFSFMIQSILFVFDFASLTSRLKRCFFCLFYHFCCNTSCSSLESTYWDFPAITGLA